MSALYSYQGATPAALPRLPGTATARIFIDGRARTDESSFTGAELTAAGYTGPYTPPAYDADTEALSWDGENLEYSVVSQPLNSIKEKKIAKIKARADALIAAGFVYSIPGSPTDPHTYQIDDGKSQLHMTSIGGLFALGVADAHGGFWRSLANVKVTMSQAECVAFFAAAAEYKMGIIRRAQQMVDTVLAAANAAGVAAVNHLTGAINGSGGWPANG